MGNCYMIKRFYVSSFSRLLINSNSGDFILLLLYLQMKLREWIFFWWQFKILCGLTTCPISIAQRSEQKLRDSDSFIHSVITEIEPFLTTF